MKKKFRVVKNFKIVKRSCSLNRYYRVLGNCFKYCEVPNRRADQNKRAGLEESDSLLAYLLSKIINEQGRIFHFTK